MNVEWMDGFLLGDGGLSLPYPGGCRAQMGR